MPGPGQAPFPSLSSELFRLSFSPVASGPSQPLSSPWRLITCKCRIWQPPWKTELGLPVPGPLPQKLLGSKEQCPLLPHALSWRLRVARRFLRPQAAVSWVHCLLKRAQLLATAGFEPSSFWAPICSHVTVIITSTVIIVIASTYWLSPWAGLV